MSTTTRRPVAPLVLGAGLLAGALLLTGCTVNAPAPVVPSASQPADAEPTDTQPTDADPFAPASQDPASQDPADEDPATPDTNPNGGYWPAAVQAAENPRLGHIVTDGEGFTLYRFDEDTASPSTTSCYGECATTWPPVLTRNKIVYTGIDRALLGTTTRDDGSLQVTLNGWPVYRFSGDTEPGQINGEAVGGVWFTAAPDGAKANGDG